MKLRTLVLWKIPQLQIHRILQWGSKWWTQPSSWVTNWEMKYPGSRDQRNISICRRYSALVSDPWSENFGNHFTETLPIYRTLERMRPSLLWILATILGVYLTFIRQSAITRSPTREMFSQYLGIWRCVRSSRLSCPLSNEIIHCLTALKVEPDVF